ncbi:hypothetical protein BX666DRAFT_2022234 [Dichotomocladium elegans]|nr:hypothetical protein BX666DRAFT_2022234 [Dichotomocladium elegans]
MRSQDLEDLNSVRKSVNKLKAFGFQMEVLINDAGVVMATIEYDASSIVHDAATWPDPFWVLQYA